MVTKTSLRCVASVLILTMLMNFTLPTVQAGAFSWSDSTKIAAEDRRSWNTAESLEYSNTLNSLGDISENAEVTPRDPDIGTVEEPEDGLWGWLKELFSGNTEIKSSGENSSAFISKNIVDKGTTLVKGRNYVKVTPNEGSFDVKSSSECAVRYTDVFKNVDYQFSASDGNAQIKIICEGELEKNSFKFNLEYPQNLTLEKGESGYVICNGKNPVFTVSAPVAKDMSGATSEAELTISDNGEITVKADKKWAQSLNRAYPISVKFNLKSVSEQQPVAVRSKPAYAKSTEINGATYTITTTPSFDYIHGIKTVKEVVVSVKETNDGNSSLVFLSEDGSKIEKKIGTETEIKVAITEFVPDKTYTVYVVDSNGETPLEDTFLIYQIDEKTTLQQGSVYYLFFSYSGGASLSSEEFQDFKTDNNFTEQSCLFNGPSTLFIRNPKVTGHINVGGYKGDELPQFVSWLLGNGVTDINELGLEPINFNTGNFVYSTTDVTLPDYNTDFTIERTYNALAAKIKGAIGYGWTFNYDISLRRTTGGAFIFSMGDGRTIWFEYNGSDFVASADKNYTFAKASGGYTVTDDQTKKVYKFDYYGYLKSITDVSGNVTTFTYGSDNNLKSIKTAAGYTIDVKCDAKDRITQLTLPDGNTITYTYDDNGNLSSVTDQENRITKYTYDSSHRILTVVDPEGKTVVNNTYDSEGRVVKQLDANKNVSTLKYESGKTTVTDNNGNVTQIFYDDLYRTTKVINPDGSVELKTWDDASNKTSETDTAGAVIKYEYNSDGMVTKETREDGKSSSYTYNAQNKITSYTDFAGNKTTYAYDSKGNLTKVLYADGSAIEYTYNDNSQLTEAKDQLGNVTKYEYTGALATAYIDAEDNRTEFGYGQTGMLTAAKDAQGNVTRYLYNKCGERYGEQRPDGSKYIYTYNKSGLVTAITDELGYKTQFTYDDQGNMLSGTDPLGNTKTQLSYYNIHNYQILC
ncbi:MAG: DUF6531 domain-containing protein [Acutalibacteraceae bacterium]